VRSRRLTRGLLIGLLAVAGGTSAAVSAAAREPSVTEYQAGLSADNGAWDLVDGRDGKVWFTEDTASAFGSITAGDGLISEFAGRLPLAGAPKGIAKIADGSLWIAESGQDGAIARVTKEGAVTEFRTGLTPSDPWDITVGPDKNLWFVSRAPAFVGRVTRTGDITEFSSGLTPNSMPSAITAGPDGNLWFTESADPGRIGRITPDGEITENSIGLTPNRAPTDITTGPDGNLWFTENGGAIGRITPDGEITEFTKGLSPGSRPTGIALGPDGALWFTDSGSPGRIGRITKHGDITEYRKGLTPDRAPWMITPGPDGNMWFTQNANPGAIARISLPPLVETGPVTASSDNSALLTATVRPNAQPTEYHFEYGRGESLNHTSASASAGSGLDPTGVTMRIAGLKADKKYHYRVVATNDSGETAGEGAYFTTEALKAKLGELVVAQPTGRVRFKRPGGRWRPLQTGAELPVGVALDTRRGAVQLTSARSSGATQTGRFGGGVLQVRQPARARGRVDLHLRGGNFRSCTRAARRSTVYGSRAASAAASRRAVASASRRVRRLWGSDRGGRYRTHGRHSHATVRGTRWVTVDRCDGTLTKVTSGAVVVRDLARRRNVLVRAGRSYLARNPSRAGRRR
jgi:streptogramin lyase